MFSNLILKFQGNIYWEGLWKTHFLKFPLSSSEKKITGFVRINLNFYFSTDLLGEENWKETLSKKIIFRLVFSNCFALVQKKHIWAQILNKKMGKRFLFKLKQRFINKFCESWVLNVQWSFWGGKFQQYFQILSGKIFDGVPKLVFGLAQMHIPGWLFWKMFFDRSLAISRQKFLAGVYMSEMNSTCKQIPSEKML